METVLRSLPETVESYIRLGETRHNAESIWARASAIEAEIPKRHVYLVQDEPVYAGEEDTPGKDAEMPLAKKSKTEKIRREPYGKCNSCGIEGHWRKDCSKRNTRCANCGKIGHVKAACRNLAVKDVTG